MRLDVRGEYPSEWPEIAIRVRTEAGHRCVRCHHRFVPRRDGRLLGLITGPGEWTPCDEQCAHEGPVRTVEGVVYAQWRILTVHHLDGDKSNCRWWNLLALCQRCHLYIQGKVIPERPWLFDHTAWFRPYVAGFYAWYYGEKEITREDAEANTDEWLTVGQPWRAQA